ncbi:thioredoxin family protein [Candidatus Falkowbacteria bacterium]|nr:thioredoxin family protein [Candidatus Falkowbacteria bacterium]
MSNESQNPKVSFIFGLVTGLAVFGIIGFGLMYSKLKPDSQPNGDPNNNDVVVGNNNPDPYDFEVHDAKVVDTMPHTGPSTFEETSDPLCQENGKPAVYLFSTTWCPHCAWIQPTFDRMAKDYQAKGGIEIFHWEMDLNDNTLTSEVETQIPENQMTLYQKYNPEGFVPTFIIGCKQFRVGNGYEQQNDLVSEEVELRTLIDALLE